MSWQKHIFIPGKRYRVRQGFASGPSIFDAEEHLVFERDGYSPYDNSFVYEFRGPDDELRSWLLHKDDPTDSWQKYFEPLDS